MTLHPVAKVDEFVDLKPLFVNVDGVNIGVYRLDGRYYAYLDRCPHQGGPACEGIVTAKVECDLSNGRRVKEYTSTKKFNISCPWHGLDFDLETGICRPDQRWRLLAFRVVLHGDEVKIEK